MKKTAESKKVEAMKKVQELCKSKQDLLAKQMAEQKKLIAKIEERKGSMKAEERTAIMKLIKTLSESISKTKEDLQKLVQISANKRTASDVSISAKTRSFEVRILMRLRFSCKRNCLTRSWNCSRRNKTGRTQQKFKKK